MVYPGVRLSCFIDQARWSPGFRAEHALAVAMADASPELKSACEKAVLYLAKMPATLERDALVLKIYSKQYLQ
jgi:hypothetical protein